MLQPPGGNAGASSRLSDNDMPPDPIWTNDQSFVAEFREYVLADEELDRELEYTAVPEEFNTLNQSTVKPSIESLGEPYATELSVSTT